MHELLEKLLIHHDHKSIHFENNHAEIESITRDGSLSFRHQGMTGTGMEEPKRFKDGYILYQAMGAIMAVNASDGRRMQVRNIGDISNLPELHTLYKSLNTLTNCMFHTRAPTQY